MQPLSREINAVVQDLTTLTIKYVVMTNFYQKQTNIQTFAVVLDFTTESNRNVVYKVLIIQTPNGPSNYREKFALLFKWNYFGEAFLVDTHETGDDSFHSFSKQLFFTFLAVVILS